MFIDLTAPGFSINDVVKLKRKSAPFKIIDIIEEEGGEILYIVKSMQHYAVDVSKIEYKLRKQK